MFGGHDIGTELGANVTNVLWEGNTIISVESTSQIYKVSSYFF